MKNTGKKSKGIACSTAIMLLLLATVASATLIASINTNKETYSPTEQVIFGATAKLTECEVLETAKLLVGGNTCSLPKQYGDYTSFGNCNLDVTVTESNPDNCYTTGGSNTVEYEIIWTPEQALACTAYEAQFSITSAEKSASASTDFSVICPTTTTIPATTSTTTSTCPTTTTTPESSTTSTIITTTTASTTTTTSNVTTTTNAAHRPTRHADPNGNGGNEPARPVKIIASCEDNIKNYGETDVDCGGKCDPCDEGRKCINNSDCVNRNCIRGICRQPSCTDQTKNQNETDTDCGGACPTCQDGKKCKKNADCASDNCDGGICKPKEETCATGPTCTDEIRNQDETDVDCGGSCTQCDDGKRCKEDSDCTSNYCYKNICRTPSCNDSIQNQGEKGTDCGGPCKACAATGVIGYITAISGDLGNMLLILIILVLLALLFLYLSKKRKYVATAEFINDIESDEKLESFIKKKKPHIVAGTSRKLRRLKKFIDEGKLDIIWIKDWDFVSDLVSKGLDDNNAESLALAKQLKAGLYTRNPDTKRMAEEHNIKVYDSI